MIASLKNLKIGNITKNHRSKKEKQKNAGKKCFVNYSHKETTPVSWAREKKFNYQTGRN